MVYALAAWLDDGGEPFLADLNFGVKKLSAKALAAAQHQDIPCQHKDQSHKGNWRPLIGLKKG